MSKVTCPYCGAESELDPVQRCEPTLYASDYRCLKCKQRFSAFFTARMRWKKLKQNNPGGIS